ncbi:unnamed protein product [Diabrotica balteata]|uniref:Glycerol-3-phosphate dehydrogenase n=1 Tax=Diabrotica balteata TaxID=107213 RepID=A0A9P0E4L5_DIABA|nr:unnamed protein product [Diabrotica balteata]
MASRFKKIAVSGITGTIGAGIATYYLLRDDGKQPWPTAVSAKEASLKPKRVLPTRADQIKSLQSEKFDIVIIGGGATGAGCALDAATRGLKTALIEADDFASGTSSRSTKLIHGGVRYLQKAIMQLDYEQYRMVQEALHERAVMLHQAPHLAHPLPIMLPVYRWWQVPYYWAGIKMYDLIAGRQTVKSSYFLSKKNALELFPMLRGDKLVGGLVYYDGQQDDARMNLAVAVTATVHGATIANHVSATSLIKEKRDGKDIICGVNVKDEVTGKTWSIPTKCVINATGPFTDSIRKMDNPKVKEICAPSSGVHITLPGYYSPEQMGLLDPDTSDGRVIFFLPWQRHTIAGTTDLPCKVTHNPKPTEDEIMFILEEVKNYLNPDVEVRRGDVLSAWSGIRPLVSDPNKPDTQSLARNHIVHVSESGLVTIAGGKWTTYRSMAVETIDEAIRGKRWPIIGKKLHPEFPYIDAEVRYGVKEYAVTAIDMIARRLRLAFLNVQAAQEALPDIVNIMAEELGWSEAEKQKQIKDASEFLQNEMGQNVNRASRDKIPINLSKEEIQLYIKRFQYIDKDRKGYVSINDIRRSLKQTGEKEVSGEELHDILKEIDTNMNGQVELDEYLQMMSAIKSGHVAYSRFARMAELEEIKQETELLKKKVSVERSGGGL